jgi:hypothetical protein
MSRSFSISSKPSGGGLRFDECLIAGILAVVVDVDVMFVCLFWVATVENDVKVAEY